MPTKAERPSEGGHWYDQHGNQIGEVERAKGDGMRKPTLRDARKHNWQEGRQFVGLELKRSYYKQACANLATAAASGKQASLFA
jgi:hypothetical protein